MKLSANDLCLLKHCNLYSEFIRRDYRNRNSFTITVMKAKFRDFVFFFFKIISLFYTLKLYRKNISPERYYKCFLSFSKYGMRSVPFIVSFDTAVFTGYPVEREFLCDKAAMVGDTIKKTLYN